MSEAGLREFFETVEPHLNERQRRVVFGSMAQALGGRPEDGGGVFADVDFDVVQSSP